MKQSGLFSIRNHLTRLSANGDPLKQLGQIVNFEGFRAKSDNALAYSNGAKSRRPPHHSAAMSKILILAEQTNVVGERMGCLIRKSLAKERGCTLDRRVRQGACRCERQTADRYCHPRLWL